MVTRYGLLLMAGTFLIGLLAVHLGLIEHHPENTGLHQKMAFATDPHNKGEYFKWKQARVANATVTNVKINVQDSAGNSMETYIYVYTETGSSARLIVYAELVESGRKNLYEIEDSNLDGIADFGSGKSVNFASEVPGEIYNQRVLPKGAEADRLQEIYVRSISLLPSGVKL